MSTPAEGYETRRARRARLEAEERGASAAPTDDSGANPFPVGPTRREAGHEDRSGSGYPRPFAREVDLRDQDPRAEPDPWQGAARRSRSVVAAPAGPGGRGVHDRYGAPAIDTDDGPTLRGDGYHADGHEQHGYEQHEYQQYSDERYGEYQHDGEYAYDGEGYEMAGHDARPRRRGRRVLGFVVVLAVLAVVGLGGWTAWDRLQPALDGVGSVFDPPPDYTGPPTGSTTVTIASGDSSTAMGQTLLDAGVVASVKAFVSAAKDEPLFVNVQPGTYQISTGIPAAEAVATLVDPANIVRNLLTIPEGQTVSQIVERVAAFKGVTTQEVQAALTQLNLPPAAQGDPEGFLYPDSYELGPNETVSEIFQEMVDHGVRTRQQLGAPTDPTIEREIVIKASLVQAEGLTKDFPNVASVIENRLSGATARTNGLLQFDSTCRYAIAKRGSNESISECEKDPNEPYNTNRNPGLPPGPINAPGADAVRAVLNPPQTDYGFFVTVNTFTGETRFTSSYDEFLTLEQEFLKFCRDNNQPAGCQ